MAESNFYLGKFFDVKSGKVTKDALQYDPADLTTHAVVTGMTGSGKTGLCIGMLEEAALQGVPAIIIDPKGDLTNLLLHFPNLLPQDFQPWIDPEMERRSGKSIEEIADEASSAWGKGLKEWGIGEDRLLELQNSVKFAIYTPGSDSGIPVSVLSSLAAPDLYWESNRDVLRERISSTVTALLGLVGMNDIDPIKSREHILLSNIFEHHWSEGNDLDLTELILQTQTPPFPNLGAFPVDTFFPPKDRMELAMVLNNILAAPAFETWREGEPLDIQAMLFTPDGKPRHSIFYLAHLSDGERMFFITLLLSAVETWMRTQSGSASLRALLYMDEIYGYLPPTAVPPSKGPLLRMLKQARAFGLGLLLATQNPVDMDYKALSNTGTWFIGKLQTERDKNRLLDGLESAAGGIPRAAMDKLISSLGKRVFVMHNVHEKMPVLMQTRWTMNFLAGPLTRAQIPALNELVGAGAALQTPPKSASVSKKESRPSVEAMQPMAVPSAPGAQPAVADANRKSPVSNQKSDGSLTKPSIPAGIREYFLPVDYSLPKAFQMAGRAMPLQEKIREIVYKPVLVAFARIRFLDRKYGVDVNQSRAVLVEDPDKNGLIKWDDFVFNFSIDKLESAPQQQAKYEIVTPPLSDAKRLASLQKDFADWIHRTFTVTARANRALKVFAGPDVTQAEFVTVCSEAAREAADAEIAKNTKSIDKQLKTLKDRLAREERELMQDQDELQNRKLEAGANLLELGAGLLGVTRKKSIGTQFTKHRLSQSAKADVEESMDAIAQYKKQIADLETQREEIGKTVTAYWSGLVNEREDVNVAPKKADIFVEAFGVAWMPFYTLESGTESLPAFGEE
jgi:hypothetical protein